jgi:sec-independent protein translocase protein TatB
MFGIGLPEMILIMALALIVVGPDKLPELARSIAKGVLELKKTVSTLKEDFADENLFDSVKPELEEVANSLKDQLGEATSDGWDGIIEDKSTLSEIDGASEIMSPDSAEADGEVIDIDSTDYPVSTDEVSAQADQSEKNDSSIDAISGVQSEDEAQASSEPGKTESGKTTS